MQPWSEPNRTNVRTWLIYAPRLHEAEKRLCLALFRGTEAELVALLPTTFAYSWEWV